MIGDGVKKIGFTPFFKLFDKGLDPLRISLRQGECSNPCIGYDAAQNLSSADGKVRRLLYGIARSLAVGLVPNAPVDHHAFIVFRYCPDPIVPGCKALLRRGKTGVEMTPAATLIGRVAVAEFHPHVDAHSLGIQYTLVEPCEIVHSRIFFTACPSRLLTDACDAQRGDITANSPPIGMFTVHTAAVERPARRGDFRHGFRSQSTHDLHIDLDVGLYSGRAVVNHDARSMHRRSQYSC